MSDLEILVLGNAEMALETEGIELDPTTLEAGVRAVLENGSHGHYRVVEREHGAIAGQLLITYEWSDWRASAVWWIQSVYVWPSYRRQGCFRALYRDVEKEARARDAAGLRLYVEVENRRAQDTYRSLGMHGDRYRVFERMFTAH